MISYIWFSMILVSIVTGIYNDTLPQVINEAAISAKRAFELALSLGGIMTLWLGIMQIAEDAGLVRDIGRASKPLLEKLFPSIPKDHPAMGAITLNLAANFLGLSNAATPFGLKAMEELQSINPKKDIASDDMCMFLAINTSSVQLIPTTAISLMTLAGSVDPTAIISSSILATSISTLTAIVLSKQLARYYS